MRTHPTQTDRSADRATEFTVAVPQIVLDDLATRLERTRWIEDLSDGDWAYGLSVPYLRDLVHYWRHDFDWRAQEAAINQFSQHRVDVDGWGVHFIHERGRGPSPLPIVSTHGFPDSVPRFAKAIPLLTDPASHGGDAADAFDVVVPSLPGYGFSDRSVEAGRLFRVGDVWRAVLRHRARRRDHVDQADAQAGDGSSDVPAGFAMFPKDLSHRRANGPSGSSTCSDGRRRRTAVTSRRSRSRSC